MTKPFSPSDTILSHLREADRKRMRIVTWRINTAAWMVIMRDAPFMFQHDEPGEFLGIPFERFTDGLRTPSITPLYETRGGKIMIHDYDGPILHGRDQERFMARVAEKSRTCDFQTVAPAPDAEA